MKRIVSFFLCIVLVFSLFSTNASATDGEELAPYVVDFVVTTDADALPDSENNSRVTGLIFSYSLGLLSSGNTLEISGLTQCSIDVVKCGFKNLTVERRKTSSDSWEDYYEFGNVYREATAAGLSTSLLVASGYQYRVTCKHYAKKNILSVQTISNTSNVIYL